MRSSGTFVPDDFSVPTELVAGGLRLVPLRPEHNAADLEAWTSSIAHIQSTPGFVGRSWPAEAVSPEENSADIERHARDFAERIGFTYTVQTLDGATIGCVYIYPTQAPGHDADVRSWVRASHADRDAELHRAVREWLGTAWPFENPAYAPR